MSGVNAVVAELAEEPKRVSAPVPLYKPVIVVKPIDTTEYMIKQVVYGILVGIVLILIYYMLKPSISGLWYDDKGVPYLFEYNFFTDSRVYLANGKSLPVEICNDMITINKLKGIWTDDKIHFTNGETLTR